MLSPRDLCVLPRCQINVNVNETSVTGTGYFPSPNLFASISHRGAPCGSPSLRSLQRPRPCRSAQRCEARHSLSPAVANLQWSAPLARLRRCRLSTLSCRPTSTQHIAGTSTRNSTATTASSVCASALRSGCAGVPSFSRTDGAISSKSSAVATLSTMRKPTTTCRSRRTRGGGARRRRSRSTATSSVALRSRGG